MLVHNWLAVVIVFLLADAEGGKHDDIVWCGSKVVYELTSFGGEAKVISSDGQHCGVIASVGVINCGEAVHVIQIPFRLLEAGVAAKDYPVDDRVDKRVG